MVDDAYEVDPDVVRNAAGELARQVRDITEHRASVRWATVDECGSAVVSEAVGEVADWYLASWARVESGLVWLAETAAAAADEYSDRERVVTGSFEL